MASLDKLVNPADPTMMKGSDARNGLEAQRDFDVVIEKIWQRVQSVNTTDPLKVQHIVEEELSKYDSQFKLKVLRYVQDAQKKGILHSSMLLKAGGIQVVSTLGPRGISPEISKALQVSVVNDIGSLTADMQKRVTAALIEGVGKGEGARELTRRLQDATGMDRNRADLIARTEALNAYRETGRDQYSRYGVEKVQWYTATDERVCDECDARHLKTYDIGSVPDHHPRCRCAELPVIPEVGS